MQHSLILKYVTPTNLVMLQLRKSHFFSLFLFQSFNRTSNCKNRLSATLSFVCFLQFLAQYPTTRPQSLQPNCWSFLVSSSVSLSSTNWLWLLSGRSASSFLLLDRSSPASPRKEGPVDDEDEASTVEVGLLSVRLLLTVLVEKRHRQKWVLLACEREKDKY